MNLKSLEKAIDDFNNSSEGKEYFRLEKIKEDLLFSRFNKFENWLLTNSFDNLLNRLIIKHDEKYREKCYNNGYEPKPNNILNFIFDYIDNRFDIIDVGQLKCDFPNQVWFFKGYFFQIIYGQGSFTRIYNKEFKLLLRV